MSNKITPSDAILKESIQGMTLGSPFAGVCELHGVPVEVGDCVVHIPMTGIVRVTTEMLERLGLEKTKAIFGKVRPA